MLFMTIWKYAVSLYKQLRVKFECSNTIVTWINMKNSTTNDINNFLRLNVIAITDVL